MSTINHPTLLTIMFTFVLCSCATTVQDIFGPILSPVIGDICKEVGCGKGKCKMSSKNDLQYECKCDPGWKQTLFSKDNSHFPFSNTSSLKFLPCVIPNCTLDHSCSEATATSESGNTCSNASIFEPCRWANCGGGVCNKKSGLAYACECNKGYDNLLNDTAFPCFKDCSFGGNCSNLGLTLSNISTTPVSPPNLADSGTNQANSVNHEALFNDLLLAMSFAALLYMF